MHALLLTLGSYGDVHPFLGIGHRLRARGHRVTLLTNDHFRPLAEQHGLEFVPLGTAEEYQEIGRNRDIWHPRKGAPTILRKLGGYLRESYQALADHVTGDTVVVSSTLGIAARVAHEKLNVPMVSVHLAPFVFRSLHQPARLPGMFPLHWLPRPIQRRFWSGADRYLLDPLLAPAINELRAELGLPGTVTGIMDQWWHSPQRILGLWPDWFGPIAPDWPTQTQLCGFPLYDERETADLSPQLLTWLDAGDPPVAFTPGSAMLFGERFFTAAVGACQRLGLRALLLSRHDEHIPPNLPTTVRHEHFAPFSRLLPRCRALVHHGGIGTLSQALAAGVPQVVMPMAHDQADNAVRVTRFGVGRVLSPRRFTARRLAAHLHDLLLGPNASATATGGQTLATRIAHEDGLTCACDALEGFAPTQLLPSRS